MARPRYIAAGSTYLITRRCSEGRFFLRPDSAITQAFEFCLAHAAARSGVVIHAYVALSNHYHLVVTDPEGRLPEFQHWLDTYVAKIVNLQRGRCESLWAPGSYSAVRLEDIEDVKSKLLYTFLNPVKSHLVRCARDWPGARSLPVDFGSERLIRRPKGFFRNKGPVPREAVLRVALPQGLDLDQISGELAAAENGLVRQAKARNQAFLGVRAILKQSPNACPTTPIPTGSLNPSVASLDRKRRMEALERLKSFFKGYRLAWERFCRGERSVEFPYGTYLMRHRFNVVCASEP